MNDDIDNMPPYERMHLMAFFYDVQNSYCLNESQKRCIEHKLREIAKIWNCKDFA